MFMMNIILTHLLGRTLAIYNLLYISVPFTIVHTHLQRASSYDSAWKRHIVLN